MIGRSGSLYLLSPPAPTSLLRVDIKESFPCGMRFRAGSPSEPADSLGARRLFRPVIGLQLSALFSFWSPQPLETVGKSLMSTLSTSLGEVAC